jgi:hypothetical protein
MSEAMSISAIAQVGQMFPVTGVKRMPHVGQRMVGFELADSEGLRFWSCCWGLGSVEMASRALGLSW